MDCSCKADTGYNYSLDKSSWNKKDQYGILVIILFMCILIGLMNSAYLWNRGLSCKKWFIGTGIILCVLVGIILYRPILLIYAPSAILSYSLKTPEFLDRTVYFPNHSLFEDPKSFSLLKQEVTDMLYATHGGDTLRFTKDTYSGENSYIGSDIKKKDGKTLGWRILNIKVGEEYSKIAKTHFPHLVKLLKKVPEIKSCIISVLQPGIKIPIHVGYYKGIMRYMIPTHVPTDRNKVFLCVNGKKYKWTEGKGVLWDDTFLHKVYNNTNENRVVIYMDVVRPLDSPLANQLNNWFITKATGSTIVKEEIKNTEIQVKI